MVGGRAARDRARQRERRGEPPDPPSRGRRQNLDLSSTLNFVLYRGVPFPLQVRMALISNAARTSRASRVAFRE